MGGASSRRRALFLTTLGADTDDVSDRDPRPRRLRARADTLLARYAWAWLLPAILLSASQMTALGRLTAPVISVDLVAAVLTPFGLLSIILPGDAPDQAPPAGEDGGNGGGGGEPRTDLPPLPPSGGLEIDWERFEADVDAYALACQAFA